MAKISFIVLCSFVFFSGCDDSDQLPKEKADRLALQATEEINKRNYEEAERLLVECIDIHAAANNDAKLAENYATLSSVQALSGKVTPTLETLSALRELYKHAADRNSELHAMFQMAKLQFQLGNTDEAIRLVHEAFTNSTFYQLDNLHAQAAFEAGMIHLQLQQYEEALTYFTTAQRYFKSVSDVHHLIETNTAMITSLAALGNTDKAYTLFQEAEALFAANDPTLNRPKFYCSAGFAYLRNGDATFARANFLQAINIIAQNKNMNGTEVHSTALLGLGELYYANFSFPEAQQYFVAAYTIAKNRSDNYLQAYLLTRISDCLSKVSIYHNAKDGMIRASQLYEQAHTLFARMGFGIGEAITIHRLGILKELTGDEGAAISFYKRSFEKYLDNSMSPVHYSLSVPVDQLYSNSSRHYRAEEWFSEKLVGLQLKSKRYPEALTYYEMTRSVMLQQEIMNIPLEFRDPEKRARYMEYTKGLKEKIQLQLELFYLQNGNKNFASRLQQRLKYIRTKVESDAITLMKEYPVFSFIGFSQQSLRQMIDSKISPSSVMFDYCFVNDELWAFVIRPNEEITAAKLSSNGLAIAKSMHNFIDALIDPVINRYALNTLSNNLYAALLQPLGSSIRQKLVIIPPVHFSQFPFHALSEGGKSVMDMTNIAYLPQLSLMNSTAFVPRFVNNVVAFGFTTDFRWGLEFELRDIRSFYKNTTVNVNQNATVQKLNNALGEVLQISSQYSISPNGKYSFSLSDGSTTKAGISVPITKFSTLHPFQIVYLSNVQFSSNTIAPLHAVLWLLNGSASVITTQFPISSNISKMFGETFYASLSTETNPSLAYRRAMVQLGKKKEFREGFGGASYFYYGIQ